ncbi:MAG: ral secretion pathway protein [Deltaproteobacteria bacterium]|nr:ral secretion pathway protein [Deltaproteobacteria bacterium]
MNRQMDKSSLRVTGYGLRVARHSTLCTRHFCSDHRLPITDHVLSRRAGFTLLELIIVMALVALMLGLSSVFVASNLPSARLNAVARELSAAVMLARSQAETRGEAQTLTINLDAREYVLEGKPGRAMPPNVTIKVTDPFLGDVEQGTYALRFEPYGPVPAATIFLRNPTRQLVVELDPVVGAIVTRQ